MPAVAPTPIDELPPFPSSDDPDTFDALADDHVEALPAFRDQMNALGENVFDNASFAKDQADAAEAAEDAAVTARDVTLGYRDTAGVSKDTAVAAALTAVNAPGTAGTSIDALTLGAGLKNGTMQTGKAWMPGHPVVIALTADPASYAMWGTMVSYDSGTGAFSINIDADDFRGAGTFAAWTISLGGAEGKAGADGADADVLMPPDTTAVGIALTAADIGRPLICTAALTLTPDTPAALGIGWNKLIQAGNGLVTITGVGAIYSGWSALLLCDGAAITKIDIAGPRPYLHVRDERTSGTSGVSASITTWNTCVLNTVKTNTMTGVSLSSNLVTLTAGTYRVFARSPAQQCGYHRLQLWNSSDSVSLLDGINNKTDSTYLNTTTATVSGRFTLASTKNIGLRHYTSVNGNLGVAQSLGIAEVYTEMEIWKED